jgi:diguanylate cyclase (GGDEF)-like protein
LVAEGQPPEEADTNPDASIPDASIPVHHGLPIDEDNRWRETREATLRKIAPVAATSKPPPVQLRELKRYLLAGIALVSLGLLLAIVDEWQRVPHMTAANTILMLTVVGISLVAVYRARAATEGLIRTVTPTVRDPVTGLPDEQYFRLRLREEYKRVHRYGIPVSLAIIDVNNLTSVNEAYGEACGDAVLGHIAGVLESTKRASDVAVRLSDDEFALILLECAREDATQFVRRLEHYVTRQPATVTVEGQVITLWIGVCTGVVAAMEGEMSAEELVARARGNLDASKAERDRRRERWTSNSA